MKNKKKYEKKVIQLLSETLKKYRQKLIEKGISFKDYKLVIIKEADNCYTSEIRMYFYFQSELIGVIEFFIFYEGKPKATLFEFQEWFNDEFDYILKKTDKI